MAFVSILTSNVALFIVLTTEFCMTAYYDQAP